MEQSRRAVPMGRAGAGQFQGFERHRFRLVNHVAIAVLVKSVGQRLHFRFSFRIVC